MLCAENNHRALSSFHMAKHRKHRRHTLFQLRSKTGESDAGANLYPAVMQVLTYGPGSLSESTVTNVDQLADLKKKSPVLWLHVSGGTDETAIDKIGRIFGLHELAIEDVRHRHQRAKVEPYGDQLFMTLNGMAIVDGKLLGEQLSLFLGEGFVISFQAGTAVVHLDAVKERIKDGGSALRSSGADRLFYAIIDELIDGYFPVVESLGEAIENVEDNILDKGGPDCPARLHDVKRDVLRVRRSIWPARDALNVLIREDASSIITQQTRIYLRDCYDHAVRIMDFVETQREMCSDLMDLYLSTVSNRMNEIIKILTIVTLLFMPPTLVAGIYGMNFNIPEYKWPFGYAWALALMCLTAAVVWLWALRSGWLGNQKADS